MFKDNHDTYDLIDLIRAVNNEAETFARLAGPHTDVEITAQAAGFWSLRIRYGLEKYVFFRDYNTIDELRKDIQLFTISAKIMRWEEI